MVEERIMDREHTLVHVSLQLFSPAEVVETPSQTHLVIDSIDAFAFEISTLNQ